MAHNGSSRSFCDTCRSLAYSCGFLSHSSAMRTMPALISRRSAWVCTGSSMTTEGRQPAFSWREKETRPLRHPKRVPVRRLWGSRRWGSGRGEEDAQKEVGMMEEEEEEDLMRHLGVKMGRVRQRARKRRSRRPGRCLWRPLGGTRDRTMGCWGLCASEEAAAVGAAAAARAGVVESAIRDEKRGRWSPVEWVRREVGLKVGLRVVGFVFFWWAVVRGEVASSTVPLYVEMLDFELDLRFHVNGLRMSSRRSRISEEEMGELISKLQSVLPKNRRRGSSSASAAKLLKETCSYIKSLHREVDDLSERLSGLMATMDMDSAQAEIVRSLFRS